MGNERATAQRQIGVVDSLSVRCCLHCFVECCVWSLFCCAVLGVVSRFEIIAPSERERERERRREGDG